MKTGRQTAWTDDIPPRKFMGFEGNASADVVVIGAGLAGVLTAYTLSSTGKKVILLDKKEVASGATHETTAFLTQIIDTDYSDLVRTFGKKAARLIAESHGRAIDYIEEVITKESLECEFTRCSNCIYINKPEQYNELKEETDALEKVGIKAVLHKEPLKGFVNHGHIEVLHQGKFHPLKCMHGLLQKIVEQGSAVYEHTEVIKVHPSPIPRVVTENGEIETTWIVCTTYEPFKQPPRLFFKKGMYDSFVIEATLPPNIIQEGIYEDTENPYHYFRIDKRGDYDRMIIGGEDHRSDIHLSEEKSFNALEEYINKTFSPTKINVTRRWDGPILEPIDGLAFIGPYRNKNTLYAFGFSGNGMTYSGITAMLFRDFIMKKSSPWEDIYKVDRVPKITALTIKARDYLEELINGVLKNLGKG